MGYSFETLKVLLWKHAVVRKRRFIHTAIELLAPIALFAILFFLRTFFYSGPDKYAEEFVTYNEPYALKYVPDRIVYTPQTPLTDQLMAEVGKKLNLRKMTTSPDHHGTGYWSVKDLSGLSYFIKDIKTYREAIVIFEKLDTDTWPRHLNYTIRMAEDFKTDTLESLSGTHGSHERFGTEYQSFMCVQWAIDSSYLKLQTGVQIEQDVYLQEFPYLRSKSTNSSMDFICPILQVFCWLSLMLPFVFLVSRLLEERSTGIQELVKMTGVSANMLGLSHALNSLPSALTFAMIGAMFLTVSETALLPHTGCGLIMLALGLHYCTVVAMAFAASFISKTTNYSTTLATFTFMFLWLPTRLTYGLKKTSFLLYVTGIFPYTPIYWFWEEVCSYELYGGGLTFADIFSRHHPNSAPVWYALFMMVVQSCVFFMLAWYLDKVRPGQYGVALPWNFFLQKQYWTGKQKITPEDLSEESMAAQSEDPSYFEDPPSDLDVGIKIVNVTKIFGSWNGPKTTALSNLSLNIYKGEITVLLGHNGAGKTTLMSIITGMVGATSGHVYVNGVDTESGRQSVRRDLGLCPQHNLAFADLTVVEHILFFSMLKGLSHTESKKSAAELMSRLKLQGKEHERSAALSGGMRRRLQLACALAGGASVLVLDEPTSGLDVETRRELWDLLLSLRGKCTVLLSTHFMEEADALGDRVAAIHAGRLRCRATPMHLKRAVGTGYRLSLTYNKLAKERDITEVLARHVPGASIADHTSNTLTYQLPATASDQFPTLFNELEEARVRLGIDTIGVGATTLDEVFMKLCSDVDLSDTDDTVTNGEMNEDKSSDKVTGFWLYLSMMQVLFKRQIMATLSVKWQFLALQCVLPIFIICIFTFNLHADQYANQVTNPPIAMNLDLYKNTGQNKVLLNIVENGTNSIGSLKSAFPEFDFETSLNISEDVIMRARESLTLYNKYQLGLSLDGSLATVLYTTVRRHAAPVGLNLLSNLIAATVLPWAGDGRTITTVNHPINRQNVYRSSSVQPKSVFDCSTWAVIVFFLALGALANEVALPCKERVNGSRHFQIMSGCPAALYWLVTWLYDLLVYAAVVVVATLLACRLLDHEATFTRPDFLGSLFLILTIGGMSFLTFVYFVSFFFAERIAGIVLSVFLFVFGLITPLIKFGANEIDETGWFLEMMTGLGVLFPPYPLVYGAVKMCTTARWNAYCHLNRHLCPNLEAFDAKFDIKVECCNSSSEWGPYTYFKLREGGAELLILVAHMVIYGILVILMENGLCDMFYDKLTNFRYQPPEHKHHDGLAIDEAEYVNKHVLSPKADDAALVHNLHKKYFRLLGKSTFAVKGTNFSVKKGECFGLLGVNGAGKSTTFKMLTAETAMTRGDVYANGYYAKKDRNKYLYSLGYCPQFGGLDTFLSGADNLRQLLVIRGLRPERVQAEVAAWIRCVGLERYADRVASGYSGGCMRRLAAAVALSSGAPVCLLDEPTTGVDTAARRRVWAALRRGLANNRSVIITSHSMDEMEALCNRIAIMSGGEVCALGSPAALRAAHGAGLALRLKLRSLSARDCAPDMDQPDGDAHVTAAVEPVNGLKNEIQNSFQSELKDAHKTMLHYHIADKVPYSQMFKFMERLKTQYADVLEDYSVTETTLEEVFLSFAKDNDHLPPGGV